MNAPSPITWDPMTRPSPRILLGVVGFAGSGKSTLAQILAEHHGFSEESLAAPIKAIASALFGWTSEQLFGPSELRTVPDPAWDGLTPRRALQFIGTEVARELHPDVWVRTLLRTLKEPGAPWRVVVSDVRFQNEVDAIRAAGGVVVRITRPGVEPGEHRSERAHELLNVDFEVSNPVGTDREASLAGLKLRAAEMLSTVERFQ